MNKAIDMRGKPFEYDGGTEFIMQTAIGKREFRTVYRKIGDFETIYSKYNSFELKPLQKKRLVMNGNPQKRGVIFRERYEDGK